MADTQTPSKGRCSERFLAWLRSPTAAIYSTYFLSSWGDRMWHFAVGLYLVLFDGGKLQIAATYGFVAGGCILLLGGIIGNWVDKNGRMKVIRVALFIQNLSVAVSAVGVCFLLQYEEYFSVALGGAGYRILEAVVMLFSVIACLASLAYKISIEKDWIVIIASGDNGILARLNAVTRAIDLLSKVLSPTIVGQIMTYGSLVLGAVVIAVWNVASLFVEYTLLCRIYRLVPRLASKGETEADYAEAADLPDVDNQDNSSCGPPAVSNGNSCLDNDGTTEELGVLKKTPKERPQEKSCLQLMFTPFIRLVKGWTIYARQKVVFAGLALSLLYMTVLGFDSITVGYIYSQGISESILGICTAMAGLTGLIGTFLFVRVRKYLGLSHMGIMAFAIEALCLTLAVASIWAPGSPFDPYQTRKVITSNCTSEVTPSKQLSQEGVPSAPHENTTQSRRKRNINDVLYIFNTYGLDSDLKTLPFAERAEGKFMDINVFGKTSVIRTRRDTEVGNGTEVGMPYETVTESAGNVTSSMGRSEVDCEEPGVVRTSVILFLTGIVTSRIGLWMSDLTVTQFLQESVAERERGTVNGVQSSLNMLLDMLKFVAVILAPDIHTFGILILMSFLFIILGNFSFIFHVWRINGYKCRAQNTGPEENGERIYRPPSQPA